MLVNSIIILVSTFRKSNYSLTETSLDLSQVYQNITYKELIDKGFRFPVMETGFGSHTKLHKACDDLRLDVFFKAENIEEASHGLLVLSKIKMQENSLGENR